MLVDDPELDHVREDNYGRCVTPAVRAGMWFHPNVALRCFIGRDRNNQAFERGLSGDDFCSKSQWCMGMN